MSTLSENKIHQFNLNTLRLDKELEGSKIDLLLMPGEIQKHAIVASQWHTAGDRRVCDLCASLQGEIIPVDSAEWGRIAPPIHLACFLSNRTPIYTLDGWKKIGMIKVGDYALTHKGRFRRVTRLFRSRSYRGKVITVTMKGSFKRFVVTPEHPFLTETGWKKAIDLKISDKIMIMATRCRRCKRLTPYYLKYCSRSCNSKDITDRQWSDPEHRKLMSSKISQQMNRQYKLGIRDPQTITKGVHKKIKEIIASGKSWGWHDPVRHAKALKLIDIEARAKKCSQIMKENNPSHLPGFSEQHSKHMKQYWKDHPEKHPNFIMAQRGHMTDIEKSTGQILKELKLNAVFNYPVDGCFIDWAIPDLKIGIECDGAYWRQDKEKDLIRDRRIESFGWTLLHLKELEIENDIESCRQKISRLVKNHLGNYEFVSLQIKSVKTRLLGRGRMLYNFAVKEDESYIASGLVSHNCRCNLSYITADERGVVQRIERYKPVDPDLLAKWSSKVYTDAEIAEMVKQQKKLAPKWKEAESLDEAREFAQDNIVKTGGAVDYGELSLESTNLLNQETYALAQTYRVKPDFLGSTQGWNRWVDKIGVYKPYKAPPVPDHVFAQMRAVSISGRRPSHVGLTLNEKYWSVAGRRNFDERLKQVIQQGWFKDGSIEVQKASLIRHEYGHVLDIDGKMSQGLTEKIWQAIGTESSLKEHLGGYAAGDGEREMWAELFAGYEGHRLSPTLMRLVARRLP